MKANEKKKKKFKQTHEKRDFFEGLVLSKNTHICGEIYTARHEKA